MRERNNHQRGSINSRRTLLVLEYVASGLSLFWYLIPKETLNIGIGFGLYYLILIMSAITFSAVVLSMVNIVALRSSARVIPIVSLTINALVFIYTVSLFFLGWSTASLTS
jgi:hypothetical protein